MAEEGEDVMEGVRLSSGWMSTGNGERGDCGEGTRWVTGVVAGRIAGDGEGCWEWVGLERISVEGWRRSGPEAATAAAMTTSSWSGQGAAAAVTAVGFLRRPFVSSHSRGRKLLSFFK